MRNLTTTLIAVAIFACSASAQSYEGSVSFDKKDTKAMVIEFPYSASLVEDAIVQKLERQGYKKKEAKGFLVYKNVIFTDISQEPADYMIRVERKSRKEKDESVVYFLISRNDENLIERGDALVNSNAKIFLNRLTPDVEAYNLEQEINTQEDAVTKVEKKLKSLQSDQQSMEKKLKGIQDDLKENEKDQGAQQKELDKQKEVLDAMKTKRKM
jgi:hypothetical protein